MVNLIPVKDIAFTTLFPTLQDYGSVDGQTSVPNGTTIAISSFLDYSVTLPLPQGATNLAGLYRVSVTGTGYAAVDGKWFVHQGYTGFQSGVGAGNQYFFRVTSYRSGTNQIINFRIYNNLAAAICTLPSLTLSAHGRFYKYPWEAS